MANIILFIIIAIVLIILAVWVSKSCDNLLKETLATKVNVHECKALQMDYQTKLDEVKTQFKESMHKMETKLEEILKCLKSR